MRTKRRAKTSRPWRASWKGELRFGLVRFTVEAINAHSRSGGDIHFHQLHAKCHSRIEYQKACPIHGDIDQSEIVLGYEYSRGKYVEIDPDEVDAVRTTDERALSIEEFAAPSDLDPIYLDGRIYFLKPAEAHDHEPYHLFLRALSEMEKIGIGQVVFSGKEQLAAIAPRENVLVMAMLNYAPELRDASAVDVGKEARVSAKNLQLAKDLIRSMTSRRFSISAYEDRYRDRVKSLIEAKRKGKGLLVAPPDEEEEPVINLMQALKRSLPRGKRGASIRVARPNGRAGKRRRRAV